MDAREGVCACVCVGGEWARGQRFWKARDRAFSRSQNDMLSSPGLGARRPASACLGCMGGRASVTPSGRGKAASRMSQNNVFCRFVSRDRSERTYFTSAALLTRTSLPSPDLQTTLNSVILFEFSLPSRALKPIKLFPLTTVTV